MRRGERGLALSTEAAVVLPALVLFLGLLFSLARYAMAEQDVGSAAGSSARAASLERSAPAAARAAEEAASLALGEHNVACLSTEVRADVAAVARALGERGQVHVTVTCRVSLADITLPFIPGSLTVTATRSSPVDPLRGR